MSIFISTQLVQFHYSRRLLLSQPNPENHHNSSDTYTTAANNSVDGNIVIVVLSVLFCAFICSLGLSSMIRCALRCWSLRASEPGGSNTSARLANKGVKRKALKTFPTVNYSTELKLPGLDSECVICLSDFTPGERLRLLPKCNHGFHVRCIDKWLSSHSSCPKCRQCLIETCEKIVGCSQASASSSDPTPQRETIVTIQPLNRQGFIHSYR
ncbi:RING-H2 finger protein ATL78 [Hibiscus syriacus]|uniref:RING-type E3 ubiquitin transferase n=1 Tax=Hibiscus syriacus TaxID=106335 RepID=A0A6A2X8V6_HIBSY|nr:RING-H2 finger protein ATL78-like [Hibiscus syriacus]KAE8663645.1 RING-H2 finger protein ATL78 [Hibiscus syriacus]